MEINLEDRVKLLEGRLEMLQKDLNKIGNVINVLGNWALTNSVYLSKTIGVPPELQEQQGEKK